MIHHPMPGELQHPLTAQQWVIASIKFDAGERAETDPYGDTETSIGEDSVWFGRYLVALARLTADGRRIVDAARGTQQESAS